MTDMVKYIIHMDTGVDKVNLPVVWMVSPGSRGTWFWAILTCAPYLRAGRFCTEHRPVRGVHNTQPTPNKSITEHSDDKTHTATIAAREINGCQNFPEASTFNVSQLDQQNSLKAPQRRMSG